MKYENVKIGDEFLIETRMTERLCKVTKVTPKRFECGGHVFNKQNGNEIGGGIYNFARISTITDEQRQQKINEVKKRILAKKLSEISYRSFSLSQLESVDEFIQGMQ
jgi:hypothetical protein